ncbi:K+-transporting ATPase ATPase C chain [Antricoccus suffuscus]|uniref:Potassium-transporting ATPase KdpC subunit n=1 Tax=Antricoccus suffuscus TaxID=1629062 RepID=A0A2T0ZC66_9ACTN|nr:potassium-transporting ATPase subunit KdpC [Antricoccus suffuscus]PRZ33901.1 K+-transporting ATPase ATPase C chain [Antricoccus suffuscus]
MTSLLRTGVTALRALVVFTIVLGIAFPLAIWGVGQVAFNASANGSLIRSDGKVIASSLIGQQSSGPQWFHSRPSAAGKGYDAESSSGTNLGPNNPALTALIEKRKAAIAAEEGVAAGAVPPDAVTASGSGLDPNISSAYAYLQVARVARENGLDPAVVRALVTSHVSGGVISPALVNVVELNLALAHITGRTMG